MMGVVTITWSSSSLPQPTPEVQRFEIAFFNPADGFLLTVQSKKKII
jgi:hypothetical protein